VEPRYEVKVGVGFLEVRRSTYPAHGDTWVDGGTDEWSPSGLHPPHVTMRGMKKAVNPTDLVITGLIVASTWISYALGHLPLVTPVLVTIAVPVMIAVLYKRGLLNPSRPRGRWGTPVTPRKQSLALLAMSGVCLVVGIILLVFK
jgi:hypothetical protein